MLNLGRFYKKMVECFFFLARILQEESIYYLLQHVISERLPLILHFEDILPFSSYKIRYSFDKLLKRLNYLPFQES